MRQVKAYRNGKSLQFAISDGPIQTVLSTKWDIALIEAANKRGALYPALQDQLFNQLRRKLEDNPNKLTKQEIEQLVVAAKQELGLK